MANRILAFAAVAAALALVAFAGLRGAEAHEGAHRVFEMRTYYAAEGKMDELHARFRNHTNQLFVKHGMKLIGYWTPTEGENAGKALVFILAHDSREAATASWNAFRDDPEWQAVYKETQANGTLVEKSETTFLEATDYSPIQ